MLAKVGVGPVSTSFGAVPSGSGQTLTKSVSLSSLTGTQQSLRVSLDDPADAADFRAPATTVTIPATGTTQISVSVVLPKGASAGDYQADLNLSTGAVEVAHSVLYVHIK